MTLCVNIQSAIAEEFLDVEEEALSEAARRELFKEMLKRPRQPNISFFAFTATPKFKTQAVFNEPGPDGRPPFHLYAMRQAIEEGFIMDVLEHYTTYKTYYGLIKSIEDDPQVPRRKAARALARFMSLHPHNIAQKVEVIVEHFRHNTRHRIGGRAKAMVVTASRLHAVRYKQAFDKYIKDHDITGIRSLVAFSGSVADPDFPDRSYTEVGMNEGIKESELPERFASEHYQVLLVAEKYQTGFILDHAVERYRGLDEDEQDQFKGQLASFRNLYAFLAQIIPYQDSGLEKLYSYARFLLHKLPRRADDTVFELEDEVSLKYYRLQKVSEGAIDLGVGEAQPLYGPTEVGSGKADDDEVELSTLIGKLNERFGTEFTPADQLFFDQIAESAVENDTLREAARANTRDNLAYVSGLV